MLSASWTAPSAGEIAVIDSSSGSGRASAGCLGAAERLRRKISNGTAPRTAPAATAAARYAEATASNDTAMARLDCVTGGVQIVWSGASWIEVPGRPVECRFSVVRTRFLRLTKMGRTAYWKDPVDSLVSAALGDANRGAFLALQSAVSTRRRPVATDPPERRAFSCSNGLERALLPWPPVWFNGSCLHRPGDIAPE